jgi:hypothetical protein
MSAQAGLWIGSGIAGVAGVACYILATAVVSWPETKAGVSAGLLVVSGWPILSIIYCYGLYRFVAAERDSTANTLGLIFAIAGFTTVLAMIVVQLAVGAGMSEIGTGLDAAARDALRRGLRLVDLGLDVAWDMLIGTALICSGAALWRCRRFGPWWAGGSMALGAALIVLNAMTFPWPPATRGLFDIGPAIGLFVMTLAARLALLGRRARHGQDSAV